MLLDAQEFERWRGQAARALDTARLAAGGGQHGWACFLAEQAAQLGVKGLLHGLGAEAWGHDLVRLERRLVDAAGSMWPFDTAQAAARLSRHYIPTRYPDAHASGDAGEHYTDDDAQVAMADARLVLDAVDRAWVALARAAQDDPPADQRPDGDPHPTHIWATSHKQRAAEGGTVTHPVIARRRDERRAAIRLAAAWMSRLAGRLDVAAGVVVGSVARGDFNKWSDIDVLVVSDGLPVGPRARLALLQQDAPVGVQPVGWTAGEFLDRLRRGDPLAVEAVSVGEMVYGRLPGC